jgi:spermidine synthase
MWAGGPHVTTVIGDGRAALRSLPPGPQQVVVLDAYRTHSVPPHLVTREFAEMVRQHLGLAVSISQTWSIAPGRCS